MARYFDITVRNNETNSSISYWADSFSLNDNAILSVYSRDCGNIKVKIEQYEILTIETVDVKEEWEEMKEYNEIGKRENCDLKNYIEEQAINIIRTTEAVIRAKAHQDFYDKVLNFEDYIEPIAELDGVQLYSGRDITRMVRQVAEQLKEE